MVIDQGVFDVKNKKKRKGNPNLRKLHADGRFYGKYKRKPDRTIPLEDFKRALEGYTLSTGHRPVFVKATRDKSYLAAIFVLGARKLEPCEVVKEDIRVTETHLFIKIPAFKHGERADVLKVNLATPGVDWIIKQWQHTRKGRKVWPLSPSTAYRIVLRALGVCPHWLRHNWITDKQKRLKGTPSEVDRKIMAWTGIKRRQTLDSYRLKTKQDIDEIGDLEAEVEA